MAASSPRAARSGRARCGSTCRPRAAGEWELQGTFLDGTTRTVTDAVTVEAARPVMSVQMVGRGGVPDRPAEHRHARGHELRQPRRYRRAGRLGGIPANATIESAFKLLVLLGSPDNVHFEETSLTTRPRERCSKPMVSASRCCSPAFPQGERCRWSTASRFLPNRTCSCVRRWGPASWPQPERRRGWVTSGRTRATRRWTASPVSPRRRSESELKPTDLLPGKACYDLVADQATEELVEATGGTTATPIDTTSSWALGGAACLTDIVPFTEWFKVGKKTMKVVSQRLSGLYTANEYEQFLEDCLDAASRAKLTQRAVTAIDPNDIEGPPAAGPSATSRAICRLITACFSRTSPRQHPPSGWRSPNSWTPRRSIRRR